MKILYHHRTQGRGGEGVHIRETIKALRLLGHEIFVVSPPGVNVFAEDENVETREAEKSILTRFWSWISKTAPQVMFELMEIAYNVVASGNIKKVIADNKIDFIYERYAFFMWAGTKIARRTKIPIIVEVNEVSGIGRQRDQVLTGIANRIERNILKNAGHVVVVSSYLKDEAVKRTADPRKVTIVPNGVNERMFSPGDDGRRVRDTLGLGSGIVLGFAGYFSKWDRLDKLMDVFCDIAREHLNVRLMLIGNSRNKKELEELYSTVKAKGISDKVAFSGRVKRSEMPAYIAAVDICLIPHSNPFGSPLVLFEYMSMARAIIAPGIAPVTDVITDGSNGALFELGDYGSLKSRIIELVKDGTVRKKLGDAARASVLSDHTWIKNAEKIIKIANLGKA